MITGATGDLDEELSAVRTVVAALQSFDGEARARIICAVACMFGMRDVVASLLGALVPPDAAGDEKE